VVHGYRSPDAVSNTRYLHTCVMAFATLLGRKLIMPSEITQLDQPIDVMYLIHKAIRAEARCTRRAASIGN
jgi:hypothetical protein